MSDTNKFQGFGSPKQNWFKTPNEWTDITAEISTIAEMKVVEYLLKHTWGYQEYGVKKHISVDEFMNGRKRKDGSRIDKGTGLSKPSVIAGLKKAVSRGLVKVEINDNDKARIKKYYGLFMKEADEDKTENGKEDEGLKPFTPEVKSFYPRGKDIEPRTEKDTLERQQHKKVDVVVVSEKLNNLHKELDVETKMNNPDTLAAQLLEQYGSPDQILLKIDEKVRYYRYKIDRGKHIANPTGWVINALKTDYTEAGFKTQSQLIDEAAEKERKRQQQAQRETEEEARWQEELERRQHDRTPYDDIWDQSLAQIKSNMPTLVFATRYSLTKLKNITDDGVATIIVPNQETLAWLTHQQQQNKDRFLKPTLESLGHPISETRFELAESNTSQNMQTAQNQNLIQPP